VQARVQFLSFLAFLLVACARTVGSNLEGRHGSRAREAVVGAEVRIELEANATTGYRWEFTDAADSGTLELEREDYERPTASLPGAGGKSVWTFRAVKPGDARLVFQYRRPWETDVAPARVETYAVHVVK
jgi:inhibitor of cysteine peptidase